MLGHFQKRLPADRVVEHWLIFERGFSNEAARHYLRKLRSTLAYAGIASHLEDEPDAPRQAAAPASDSADEEPAPDPHVRSVPGQAVRFGPEWAPEDPPGTDRPLRAVQIPYSISQWAVLQAPFPLSEAEFGLLITMIQAMKPGLVDGDRPVQPDNRPPAVRSRDARGGPVVQPAALAQDILPALTVDDLHSHGTPSSGDLRIDVVPRGGYDATTDQPGDPRITSTRSEDDG